MSYVEERKKSEVTYNGLSTPTKRGTYSAGKGGRNHMAKKLSELQIAAIEFLALPKRGGLTYEQVAEKVGITDRTLRDWRKDDAFNEELKRQVVRNTLDRLPEIMASTADHIINDGNAAMFRTLLQAHGMLTDKVEIDSKGNGSAADIDTMKAEIERMRAKRQSEG
jgi:transcriptional regulator with XRE-family HTH domain